VIVTTFLASITDCANNPPLQATKTQRLASG
jgi:hypothetical protein